MWCPGDAPIQICSVQAVGYAWWRPQHGSGWKASCGGVRFLEVACVAGGPVGGWSLPPNGPECLLWLLAHGMALDMRWALCWEVDYRGKVVDFDAGSERPTILQFTAWWQ